MINIKDWKKYSDQVELYNQLEWKRIHKLNEEMRAKHRRPLGYFVPWMMSKTVEGCLDWIAKDRPTLARKIQL